MRFLASGGNERVGASDKVFRDMAITNFGPNLKILADKVNELYVKVVAIDKESAGRRTPSSPRFPSSRKSDATSSSRR